MLNINRALKNDRLLRALTGLNRKAFEQLREVFEVVYQESIERETKPRKRARGGGRKARLSSIELKLFFILFYFKCDPTFDVLSWLFDLERGRANRWVHRLQGILEIALSKKMVLPERKLENIEQFLERFPAVKEVIFDGTQRPVQRPKDVEKLSDQQKQENKEFSSQRVVCEHAHAGLKRYNAVSAIYRNRVPNFDDSPSERLRQRLMLTATGLWNFYLEVA